MGQLVAVTERPASKPGMIRFEANRSLTGMGHESFHSVAEAIGPRPAAVIARLLLGSGQAESIHIYGNMITVDLAKGSSGAGLGDLVRDMYQFWTPGKEMPSFDAPADEPAAAATADAGGGGAGGGAPSKYDQLVPQNLRDRSASALAKWKASH